MEERAGLVKRLLAWPFLAALVLSLLLHLLLLAAGGPFWGGVTAEIAFPIEASLEMAQAPPQPVPAAKPPPPQIPKPVISHPEPPKEMPEAEPAAPERTVVSANPVPEESPSQSEVTTPAMIPVAPEPAPVTEQRTSGQVLRPAVRQLPEQMEIRYAVAVGEDGFVAGEALYQWHARAGRYSLVSTIQATGLTALFIHGRIVQVSEGFMDDKGLHPEQYWLRRGERKQDSARFLWAQNRLDLGPRHGLQDLTAQAQDLLSFPFHLAMTTAEAEPDFVLGVTNGRRFKQYAFRNLGRTTIELGRERVEVLHLQGRREGEGTLDVWLDPARAALPIKVRTLDEKGKTMMLLLRSLRDADGG